MASIECPFCGDEFGCEHLIGEGDDQIIWSWDVIATIKVLCEEADLMKIDIGKLAQGVRSFEDLTPATQDWCGDFVPWVIVDAPGIILVDGRSDADDGDDGPPSGTYYGVFIDPKHTQRIEEEFEELVERLEAAGRAARKMIHSPLRN